MAYTTIDKSSLHFNAKLWNGNSTTNTAITGVGFQPDFVWLKQRTGTQNHQLLDAIRGANNCLFSNLDNAAVQDTEILNSFDSDGYTLGYQDQSNDTGATYVGWNWKANGAGSANTNGSINTTATSANTTAGFSIVKYTGTGSNATIGHGLGSVPSVVLVKKTSGTGDWIGYFKSLGNTKNARLNTTDAADTNSTVWNSTTPTSSVFSVGTFGETNGSGATFAAYCFAEKKGFSKFGSYTGNGNNDGAFIYTGFKPAWVMVKRTNTAEGWYIIDNKRTGFNEANYALIAQANGTEETGTNRINLLSNGFKATTSNTAVNGSGDSYIFMAFAEAPLVGSNNVPATAR
jgi:hypothetical protein